MRLKCVDGKVRDFSTSGYNRYGIMCEVVCNECGHIFGCHEFTEEKRLFKQHSCKPKQKEAQD